MTAAKSPKKKKAVKKTVKKSVKKTAAKDKKVLAIQPAASLVGKKLPGFSLAATGGKNVSLELLTGQKFVLYFYPKDSTPGCTLEGHDFSKLKGEFKKSGALVFGISRDSMKSHEKFKAKENYSVDLLSDEDETVCKIFGVIKMKNMYGKQVLGIERSTFVFDAEGKLRKEWRGVKVPGHAEEVLAYVKSL